MGVMRFDPSEFVVRCVSSYIVKPQNEVSPATASTALTCRSYLMVQYHMEDLPLLEGTVLLYPRFM
jgi:hypothetical protein